MHLKKEGTQVDIINERVYKPKRVFQLLEVISCDLQDVIRRILDNNKLIKLEYKDF
jgi:hypothetical protein